MKLQDWYFKNSHTLFSFSFPKIVNYLTIFALLCCFWFLNHSGVSWGHEIPLPLNTLYTFPETKVIFFRTYCVMSENLHELHTIA
jgi:hypothetical protein